MEVTSIRASQRVADWNAEPDPQRDRPGAHPLCLV